MIALSCHERASIILEESKRHEDEVNRGKSAETRLELNFSIVLYQDVYVHEYTFEILIKLN